MARARIKLQSIELFEFLNTLDRRRTERRFAVERVQYDSLKQIAEGEVVVFGEGFENFQKPFFNPHTGLHALDQELLRFGHVPMYHGTNYRATVGRVNAARGSL